MTQRGEDSRGRGRRAALRALASGATTFALWPLCASAAFARRPHLRFEVRVHVASSSSDGARPVVGRRWLDAQLAWANRILAPAGVAFVVTERLPLDESHAALETRADRHALGALIDPTRVDVFVVRSLRDVDDPTQMRRGVHWRPARMPGAHFVVVSQIAREFVLAHELGHYFGLPHSPTPGNLMSYEWGDSPPTLDRDQLRRIERSARAFAASMVLAVEASDR